MQVYRRLGRRLRVERALSGDLDELVTYPVALTPAQVQEHFTLGSTGLAPNLTPQVAFTRVRIPGRVRLRRSRDQPDHHPGQSLLSGTATNAPVQLAGHRLVATP